MRQKVTGTVIQEREKRYGTVTGEFRAIPVKACHCQTVQRDAKENRRIEYPGRARKPDLGAQKMGVKVARHRAGTIVATVVKRNQKNKHFAPLERAVIQKANEHGNAELKSRFIKK